MLAKLGRRLQSLDLQWYCTSPQCALPVFEDEGLAEDHYHKLLQLSSPDRFTALTTFRRSGYLTGGEARSHTRKVGVDLHPSQAKACQPPDRPKIPITSLHLHQSRLDLNPTIRDNSAPDAVIISSNESRCGRMGNPRGNGRHARDIIPSKPSHTPTRPYHCARNTTLCR